jgi:opacity protein-like surface antigen
MQAQLRRPVLSLALALLTGSVLGAAEYSLGVQLSAGAPLSDLKDLVGNTGGADVKIFEWVNLGQGHVLRPQFDVLAFAGRPQSISTPVGTVTFQGQSKITVSMESVGADYIYFINGDANQPSPYVGGGVALSRNRIEADGPGAFGDAQETKAAFSLVVGYQFDRHWNVEVGFRTTKWGNRATALGQPVGLSYTLPTILVGGGFRF